MTASHLFAATKRVARLLNEVEFTGMRVEIGGDFAFYRKLRQQQADRNGPFPMFDAASSFVDESNAFWLLGFNEEDELVHTQAIRYLDLQQSSLANHLDVHRHKYVTPELTPDPDNTYFSGIGALNQISGRVCYHGEFWLKGGKGGHRAQGFTAVLSRIAFEMAHSTWDPDYMFGLVPASLAMKGIPIRYGYSHCEPGAWVGPNREITSEEYLVWMSRMDLRSFLHASPLEVSAPNVPGVREALPNAISAVA